jgi:hypothetical protein
VCRTRPWLIPYSRCWKRWSSFFPIPLVWIPFRCRYELSDCQCCWIGHCNRFAVRQQLEQLLRTLVQRSKPDVVLASAACLAALKTRYKLPADRVFGLLRACLGQLVGAPRPEEGMARARPLFIVGAILQHFDFDLDPGFEVPADGGGPALEKGSIVATAFESLVQHALWRSGPPAQAAKLREMALRSMCLMLLQYPGLARFDATVEAISVGLGDTNDDVVMWLLMSLKTLLEQQDRRTVAARLGKKVGYYLRFPSCSVS